jgi:putative peptidoglycan lipid II flippase
MVSNIILNLILVVPLAHAGLALASSLSAYINAGLLFILLRKTGLKIALRPIMNIILKSILALTAMSLVLLYAVPESQVWFEWDVYYRISLLLVFVTAGAMIYLITLWLSGLRLRHITSPN